MAAYLIFCAHLPPATRPKISQKFWDGKHFILSGLPAQIFPEILGQETFGDYSLRFSPQNSPEILGREMLLHEIIRDLKFLGNVGTVRPKFSRKFWNEFFFYSLASNFWEISFARIFSEKFGTGALGVKFLGNMKFPDKFGSGALGLSCEISGKFRGPKFPGNLGVKFSGSFVPTKFPAKFGIGSLGLYSKKFRGPKFPGNFEIGNIWQLILFFAPTSPRQPVPKFLRFILSDLPAQIFPEILGQETFGDYSLRFSPQNSPEILGREMLLHEII